MTGEVLISSGKKATSKGWRDKHFKNDGNGHVRGYAGLVNTASKICEYIPFIDTFVEPFAGLGRVSKYVKSKKIVLNDLSDYATNYCKKKFPQAIVTQLDFRECVNQYDDKKTFMLFDPPWTFQEYDKGCLNRAICTMKPKEYYDILLNMVKTLECNWIICGNKNNKQLINSGHYCLLIQSRQKIMGRRISTLIISNKPFVRYHQETL